VGVGAAGGGGAPLRLERALPLLGLDPVVEGNHLWVSAHAAGVEGEEPRGEGDE